MSYCVSENTPDMCTQDNVQNVSDYLMSETYSTCLITRPKREGGRAVDRIVLLCEVVHYETTKRSLLCVLCSSLSGTAAMSSVSFPVIVHLLLLQLLLRSLLHARLPTQHRNRLFPRHSTHRHASASLASWRASRAFGHHQSLTTRCSLSPAATPMTDVHHPHPHPQMTMLAWPSLFSCAPSSPSDSDSPALDVVWL